MKLPEILAPVGGKEQLVAAVRAGADAVYLGTRRFNARRGAENFGPEELREAVGYCHARNVAVHVTLNTLVRDDELADAARELESIAASGADAVIVQDLAVAKLVRDNCPDLALHASTQMTLHNAAGVRAAQALGFSRVVLARELSLAEIADICRAADLEIEVFVHGALCMCVSGACYLSSMFGGRSGNRGRCAQPCRLDFRAGAREYALSLKDMSHIAALPQLRQAGVASVKIEGRMKRPEYVAAAVSACRAARDGEEYDPELLRRIFSREGFTDGYLTGRRTLDMFGHRTKDDVEAFRAAAPGVGELTRREFSAVPVDMRLCLQSGAPASLRVQSGGETVSVTGAAPEPALNRPTDAETARAALAKTGGTPFFLRELVCDIAPDLTLRPSSLNELRRDALAELLARRSVPEPKLFAGVFPEPAPQYMPAAVPEWRLRAEKLAQIPPDTDAARIVLPAREILATDAAARFGARLAAELPALLFGGAEKQAAAQLAALRERGVDTVLCENLGAVRLAREAGFRVLGGSGLNIFNSEALAEYERLGVSDVTVSFELSLAAIRALGGTARRGLLVYGSLPLMRLRACPMQGPAGCGDCSGHRSLTDRKGEKFTVLCAARQYSTLLNSVPLSLAGRLPAGVDFYTFWFTTETQQQAAQVLAEFRRGAAPSERHTGGLYFRTVE